MSRYSVVVGNIGEVHSGDSRIEGQKVFDEYIIKSESGSGRAGGEDITMLCDGVVCREYCAPADSEVVKNPRRKITYKITVAKNPKKRVAKNPPNDAGAFSNTAFQQIQNNPKNYPVKYRPSASDIAKEKAARKKELHLRSMISQMEVNGPATARQRAEYEQMKEQLSKSLARNPAPAKYAIVHTNALDEETGEKLYWSTADGWGTKRHATKFSLKEKELVNMPKNGKWQKIVAKKRAVVANPSSGEKQRSRGARKFNEGIDYHSSAINQSEYARKQISELKRLHAYDLESAKRTRPLLPNPANRNIAKEIAKAFLAGKSKKIDNTETDGESIWLHGNKIVSKRATGIYITVGDHPTITTKDRLAAFAEVKTVKGQLMLNGEPWNGEWKKVADLAGDVKKNPSTLTKEAFYKLLKDNAKTGKWLSGNFNVEGTNVGVKANGLWVQRLQIAGVPHYMGGVMGHKTQKAMIAEVSEYLDKYLP